MKKVLIIEDLQTFSITLATLIAERYGYEAYIASTLSEAKLIVSEHSEEIFVAIVDLNLPDSNKGEGIDLVNQHRIPALVFTSEFNTELRETLAKKGVADYVLKEGNHSVEYIVDMVDRIYRNYNTNVLVVDDERSSRKVISLLLECQCYQPVCAASGEEALEMLGQNKDISLAIIDFHMADMDGLELTRRIRQTYGPELLSIIGISARESKDISISFVKYGASDFIQKPFEQEDFLCRVNQVVKTYELNHELDFLIKQKNMLLGGAAHDIRGPIGVIHTAAQRALKQNNSAQTTELLTMIDRQANNTLTLLNDILSLSAIEAGKLTVDLTLNNLSSTALECITTHQDIAEKKQQSFKLELNEMADTEFDKERIKQTIDNLISNAMKYAPIGSEIIVKTFQDDCHQGLKVIDQGPGIPLDKREELYKPFYTLGSKTTGNETSTGLGLSICKDIIEAHGGKIEYQDNPSGGSCFSFQLHALTSQEFKGDFLDGRLQ